VEAVTNGVPEVITSERSRVTVEFCVAEREGRRCMLVKGHDGMHESVAVSGTTRWSTLAEPL
jgi:hypothetical protein